MAWPKLRTFLLEHRPEFESLIDEFDAMLDEVGDRGKYQHPAYQSMVLTLILFVLADAVIT